jgi:hypothetical protein
VCCLVVQAYLALQVQIDWLAVHPHRHRKCDNVWVLAHPLGPVLGHPLEGNVEHTLLASHLVVLQPKAATAVSGIET